MSSCPHLILNPAEGEDLFLEACIREAVAAPSLAVSKARLDGALSTLGWWKGSLPLAGGVE